MNYSLSNIASSIAQLIIFCFFSVYGISLYAQVLVGEKPPPPPSGGEEFTTDDTDYEGKTKAALYPYKKGNSVSLVNAYGVELIPAGIYKNFMVTRDYSVLAETFDGQVELLSRTGQKMSKARFMEINNIKLKPGIHRLIAGKRGSGSGMFYTDSLEFIGPFLPTYALVFLSDDQPIYINKDLEHSLIFELAQNRVTDTIAGILGRHYARYPEYIPFKFKNKKGFYRPDFTTFLPPIYSGLSLNLSHKRGEVFINYRLGSKSGLMNKEGEVILGPIEGAQPIRVKENIYIQWRKGKQFILDGKWDLIVDQGADKFPIRWSMLFADMRYIPFQDGGKYGILDMAGEVIDAPVHDTLVAYFSLSNQFYGIGKAGQLELIDGRKAYRYPKLYKHIYDYYDYPGIENLHKSYTNIIKQRYKSYPTAVLVDTEEKISILLMNGDIVEGKDLE